MCGTDIMERYARPSLETLFRSPVEAHFPFPNPVLFFSFSPLPLCILSLLRLIFDTPGYTLGPTDGNLLF